jgi:hypothetical protein
MRAGVRYSESPRCPRCPGRVLLTRATAEALADNSHGRLQVIACGTDDNWHVWAPTLEKPNNH